MLGLRQRIAFTAVLLIGVVPSGSKAFTIEDCYAAVDGEYQNCAAGSYYSDFGNCQNRWAERRAYCSKGIYVPLGASPKDQCLNRVQDEYKSCGYRMGPCSDRWIQSLQACNGL